MNLDFLSRIDPETIPNLKVGAHSFQLILVFVIFVLEIIVLKDENSAVNGNIAWPFAMVRLFPRARASREKG